MKIGSLFSGYGGLDMAFGGDLAWYSEIEPAACKVMSANHPNIPNFGDITKIDFSNVPEIDVLTGGYPCQPFSNAGLRKGTDDERHLWPYVRDAICAIRPSLIILENVRGHLTLGFDVVLSDLAELGLSARWGIVRASDAGAPHNRARLFIVAYSDNASSQTHDDGRQGIRHARRSQSLERDWQVAADSSGERHGRGQRPASVGRLDAAHEGSARQRQRTRQESGAGGVAHWGEYAPAIERWQQILGRPAPAPTVRRDDRDRLNPVFVEWMMGLPEGWVTNHDISNAAKLKMLGNGVVPQQASLALQMLDVL